MDTEYGTYVELFLAVLIQEGCYRSLAYNVCLNNKCTFFASL